MDWVLLSAGLRPIGDFSMMASMTDLCSSMIAFENGDGAVVMTNGARGRALVGEIMRSIAIEHDWPAGQPRSRQRITVDPRVLDRLVGTYELSPKFLIQVSREGDRLFAQATGQDRFEVFPESDRDFFYRVVDAGLTFDAETRSVRRR